MATVTLDRVWLSLASDPSQTLAFFTTGRGDTRSIVGQVRWYANGRLRSVSRVGSEQTLTVTARNLTAAQVAALDGWKGSLLLLRDVWGRKVFGTYFSLAVVDYAAPNSGQDATFTFEQITHSEAV